MGDNGHDKIVEVVEDDYDEEANHRMNTINSIHVKSRVNTMGSHAVDKAQGD